MVVRVGCNWRSEILQALRVLSRHTLMEAPVSTSANSMATLFIVSVTHKGIFLASGAANSPSEKVIMGPLFTIESTEGCHIGSLGPDLSLPCPAAVGCWIVVPVDLAYIRMHLGTFDGTFARSARRGYGGVEKEVVEQVGGLEQAGVEAWGCGLCQGHLSAAVAAVVVVVAGTIVGRVGTVVVVVVVAAVAVVASNPVGPLMSGLASSFLPSQSNSAHEDHI
ncbi:hypothetical protein Taro_024793 [Colocasia esculenta]|uniref:Uncharacterized protein n=1 Tax=Colocasia esculenta TaxID=4460 RepID=A0A843V1C9_COLES|nr:hypothetical protein [Colocasia esculenta]